MEDGEVEEAEPEQPRSSRKRIEITIKNNDTSGGSLPVSTRNKHILGIRLFENILQIKFRKKRNSEFTFLILEKMAYTQYGQ